MEGIDPEYRKNNIPILLEINFLVEAKYDNTVELTMIKDCSEIFNHSLYIGNNEICRIKSGWKQLYSGDKACLVSSRANILFL